MESISEFYELAVWPYHTSNANRGTVSLPHLLWWGLDHSNGDRTPSYSVVRLVESTLIRTRGQLCPVSGDFEPGLSYAEQFPTFNEAYEAASKMIFFERGPHETCYFYDAVENVTIDCRSE